LIAFNATASKVLSPGPEAADASRVERNQGQTLESSSPSSRGNDHAQVGGVEDRASGNMPDVSPEFRSEMAALLAHYAERIGAAQFALPASVAARVIRTLRDEQMVALRALTDRWSAASQKQQTEKPGRPGGNVRRSDGEAKQGPS
jgi:hypothetical protein